jgi:hypothetical protein
VQRRFLPLPFPPAARWRVPGTLPTDGVPIMIPMPAPVAHDARAACADDHVRNAHDARPIRRRPPPPAAAPAGSGLAALAIALVLMLCAAAPRAAVIAAWNFNGPLTGTLLPSAGAGRLSPIGVGTSIFASGEVGGGSSDPVVGNPPDYAWQVSAFPQQGTGTSTAGIQGLVDTTGFGSITLSFDFRATAGSSRFQQFQYSLDGLRFVDWGPPVATTVVDPWTRGRRFDLSTVDGVAGNPLFGFRVVSVFAPGTAEYQPVLLASSYATVSSWRFDMLAITGDPLPLPGTAVVPLPPAGVALAGGLLLIAGAGFRSRGWRGQVPAL